MIFTYQPIPGLDDSKQCVLHRLFTHEDDAERLGRELAAAMLARPPGKRAVLAAELGGGATPADRAWWPMRDANDAGAVVKYGVEACGLACSIAHMQKIWRAYAAAGGPVLDVLACNVELKPDRWFPWPDGCTWPLVKAAAGLSHVQDDADATERLGRWASAKQCQAVQATLRDPYRLIVERAGGTGVGVGAAKVWSTRVVNMGACDWSLEFRDLNGWKFWDNAPDGVSAPFLYLQEPRKGEAATVLNVRANNRAALERCAKGVGRGLLPVFCPPGFAGSGRPARDFKTWRASFTAIVAASRDMGCEDCVFWCDGTIDQDNKAVPWTSLPVKAKDAGGVERVMYEGKKLEGEEAAFVAGVLGGR